jgi:hypothetical protein
VHWSLGEAQIGRWKMVIGPKLKARIFPNQKTEARIGTNILNKMNRLGRDKYEAVTLLKSWESDANNYKCLPATRPIGWGMSVKNS